MEVDDEKASGDEDEDEDEDLEAVEEARRAKEEAERLRQEAKEQRRAEKEFSTGRWRNKMSGKVLGEVGEEVEFTVVA